MRSKTISGHYDTIFSIDHNNRTFVPKNVDQSCIPNNYNLICAGQEVQLDLNNPTCLRDFWGRYRELGSLYWEERTIAKTLEWERYQEHLRALRRISWFASSLPDNGVEALVTLFLLPLLIPCGIYLSHEQQKIRDEWESGRTEQLIRDMEFKASQRSLRDALRSCDREHGTRFLKIMDSVVTEMSQIAGNLPVVAVLQEETNRYRFATVEQIYSKVFQPAFETFQARQRPYRRYSGTYLEQIREKKNAAAQKGSCREKQSVVVEAYEIVFTVGDMDNTGYARAPLDAKQAEELLKDFCDHLRDDPHICFVTTRELEDPDWEPPFRHGLIAVNLVTHCDEATPGVHFTFIPFSKCSCGPEVQASLGRALTGMGYPSKWVEVLDEQGNKIPKVDRNGNVIREKDSSIRYKKEAQGQGLIDWIEDQKQWIQNEMLRRYGWEREYKGSHPRGSLSTPDYKVARAEEWKREIEAWMEYAFQCYSDEVYELSAQLEQTIDDLDGKSTRREIIDHYLDICPDETYYALVEEAVDYLHSLPDREHSRAAQPWKN